MPALSPRAFLPLLVFLGTLPAMAQLPKVQEHRFANGLLLLLVERPGSGSLHARLQVRGGRADTGVLPAGTAEVLARTLFGHSVPAGAAAAEVDALLAQEEGAFESLQAEQMRRRRAQPEGGGPEETALAQLHAQRLQELQSRLRRLDEADPRDGLGATRVQASAQADALTYDLDLPSRSFEAWCRVEAQRLQQLPLGAFPVERESLLREGTSKATQALSVLLGSSFSGHPYAQVLELQRSALESVTSREMRDLARDQVRPERITLVLVGDLSLETAVKYLGGTLGAWGAAIPDGRGRREDRISPLPEAPGFRRLQAGTTGEPRLFMAWRIPAASHPDEPALRILATALGGSRSSRLVRRVQEERGLARSLSVRIGVPGGRDASLFLIEAQPAEGHGLAELEEAIHGEVLRIQRELFPEEDLRRAQRFLEAESLLVQEDATVLAQLLGDSVVRAGDWRQGFRLKSLGRDLSPQEIQTVARRYLVPDQGITALLDADPLLSPRDPVEERLGKALTALVQRTIEDPAQVEAVVRETLRQLRMLSVQEREQTLKLLEAQAVR